MREIPYVVLRTAALSGHPHDSGQWLVNLCRLQHGEGFLELGEEGSTVYLPDDAPEPLSTPRSTDARLHNLASDVRDTTNRASQHPKRLQDLATCWYHRARLAVIVRSVRQAMRVTPPPDLRRPGASQCSLMRA